ncbi:hypothetical protein JCM8547_009232 [Rhodosporidiobolus lusitaniae]
MLDRLPTELLSHIVGLAAPLDYTPSFYLERRQFLRNACLVLKRMRDGAQPMPVEVYEVKSEEDAERLEETDEEGRSRTRASQVKLLVVNGWDCVDPSLSDLLDLPNIFAICRGLVELRILAAGTVDLDWLAALTALTAASSFATIESSLQATVAELVWEEQADWHCESLISPWSWRRARRIKQDEGSSSSTRPCRAGYEELSLRAER